MSQKKEPWENMSLYKKAKEILHLSERIIVIIEDRSNNDDPESEILNNYADYIMENACMIPAKIAGVYDVDTPYDLKMENAAIIRKAAREIATDTRGLEMYGFKDIEHLELLRQEIEAFRVLFAEWVKTFDPWNYIIDRWGLFNPPGIHYDDKDPDDDLPFNPDDF